jgi:hypothetical protein
VSLRALAAALLIAGSGFLLGRGLEGGSTRSEPVPQPITTHDSPIQIPNLREAAAIPTLKLSRAAGPRTSRPAP